MKVVIAGAGLGGLVAAWRLHQAGHDVEVFEASDRVGGRTWSQRLSNGAVVERGGEFIFPGEFTILRLCAELGLRLVGHGVPFYRRHEETAQLASIESLMDARSRLNRALEPLRRAPELGWSFREVFERALGPGFEADPVYRRKLTSMTADPEVMSGLAAVDPEARSTEYLEHSGRVLGGNQSICAALATRLACSVQLSVPVVGVSQTGSSVELALADGRRAVGDAAVIAVPLPLIDDLGMDFDLPHDVGEALSTRVMGVAAKISSELTAPAPTRGVQATERLWWAWNSADAADDGMSDGAVTCFAGGVPAVTALALPAGDSRLQQRVAELRPDLRLTGELLVTDWSKQQWSKGSYSVCGLDWRPELDNVWDRPVGRVAFAGEHASPAAVRGMDGAVRTGERAARVLLEHCR